MGLQGDLSITAVKPAFRIIIITITVENMGVVQDVQGGKEEGKGGVGREAGGETGKERGGRWRSPPYSGSGVGCTAWQVTPASKVAKSKTRVGGRNHHMCPFSSTQRRPHYPRADDHR